MCSSTNDWVKEMWSVVPVEYISSKKNEIMKNTAAWMNLENIMVSEKASHERPQCIYLIFIYYMQCPDLLFSR